MSCIPQAHESSVVDLGTSRPSRLNRGNVLEGPLRDRIADGGNPESQGQVPTLLGHSAFAPRVALPAPKPSFFSPGNGRPLSGGKLSFISQLYLPEVCHIRTSFPTR